MNKKVLFGIAALAIAAVSVFNMNLSMEDTSKNLSDLVRINVEALAQENGGGSPKGTKAKCEETTVIETYEADGGWTYSVSAKIWLLNGQVSNTTPPSYRKVLKTTKSTWDGCKMTGNTDCSDALC